MTQPHVSAVLELSGQAAGKVKRLLASRDILDPIGAGQDVYHRTAEGVEKALAGRFDEEAL